MTLPTCGTIFVNCPFDDQYKPVFDAVNFAITACGFSVSSALQVVNSGELRLEKLYRLIANAVHSLHDISRVEVDSASGPPRFNMPIELGIALGHKRFGRRRPSPRLLVLDSECYRYQAFASDLAGLDITEHGNDPARAIGCVRHFLVSEVDDLPTSDRIIQYYRAFEEALPSAASDRRQTVGELGFTDRMRLAERFLVEMVP